jgi:2-pyrone-4,6-dicarboxylate lactonase
MRLRPEAPPTPLADIVGAWDCHVHVFGDAAGRPPAPDARYVPPPARLQELVQHLRAIGAGRCVLVQPSIYGFDNMLILEALDGLGACARAVVSLDPDTLSERERDRLDKRGVRGVRLNPGGRVEHFAEVASAFDRLLDTLRGSSWSVEIHCVPEAATDFVTARGDREIPLVFDHVFALDPARTDFVPHVEAVLSLAARPGVWVKLSGLDRVCRDAAARAAMNDVLERLGAAIPQRLVWGSDWPHTPLQGIGSMSNFRDVELAREIDFVVKAIGGTAQAILVENPRTLYRK